MTGHLAGEASPENTGLSVTDIASTHSHLWVERRAGRRVIANLRIELRMAGGEAVRASVVDLSPNGLGLHTRRKLEIGHILDVEVVCELPLRVHLGFDMHALVVDGPMFVHSARVPMTICRAEPDAEKGSGYRVGLELCDDAPRADRRGWDIFLDHVRDHEAGTL